MTDARRRSLLLAACGALATTGACSYTAFSDLAAEAPATRIEQEGEVHSSTFGDFLAGFSRGASLAGGALAISGNADPALTLSTFGANGLMTSASAEADHVDDHLDRPLRITAMGPAPSDTAVGSFQGPFVYVGSTTADTPTVRVLDMTTFHSVRVYKAPKLPTVVTDFGLSVAPANFGQVAGNARRDLAVGAKNALVLLRAQTAGGAWPDMQDGTVTVASTSVEWPGGEFTVLAAGNLDPSTPEDEVIAGAPNKNAVVVAHHVGTCFADPSIACQSFVRLPLPSGASRFGAALLVADVDGDGKDELLVGTPDTGKVYVYDLEDRHLAAQSPEPVPTPRTLAATEAQDFGASLAWGRFDGGTEKVLAVGAPGTSVEGTKNAGRIFLYRRGLAPVGEGVALARPEEDMLLGRRLASLPFRSGGGPTSELLVASGRSAVLVFFSGLAPSQRDPRER